jgi:protease I
MKKALILTYTGFQDQEVVYPYYRLKGAGFEVEIISDKFDELYRTYGILGVNMPCRITYKEFESNINYYKNQFEILILPGGVKALEKLRQKQSVLNFISEWDKEKKIIASTCHGAQLLISSKVIANRKITGYPSIKDDIVNSGAVYVNEPVVFDKNIVSSPHYDFMGEWIEKTLDLYQED